jgi:hypothetical protein
MREYAVKIDIDGLVFRYATERVSITETVGGQQVDLLYLPMVVSINAPTSSISLESLPQIPTFDVEIADYYLELRTALEKGEYERVKCTVYTLENGEIQGTPSEGYVSQPSFNEATISFTIRMEEDQADGDYLDVFSFNMFQYTNIVTPTSVTLVPDFQYHESTPWTVEAYSIVGGSLASSLKPGDSEILVRIDPRDPLIASGGSANNVFIPFDTSNGGWEKTSEARLKFDSVTNRIHDVDGHVGSFDSAWGDNPSFDYIQIVGSPSNDGVYNIVGHGVDPTDGPYIQVGGSLDGLSSNETVNGGVRFYAGNVTSRFVNGSDGLPGTLILGESAMAVRKSDGDIVPSKIELVKYNGSVVIEMDGDRYGVRISGVGQGAASTHPIRWPHQVTAGVQPNNKQDRVIVALNGYRPLRDDNQPASVGFMHTEGDTKIWPTTNGGWVGYDPEGKVRVPDGAYRFKVNHRFSTSFYSDAGAIGGVSVMRINNFRLNPLVNYGADSVWSSHGHKLVRKDLGTPIRLCDFFWSVSQMEVPLINDVPPQTEGTNVQLTPLDLNGRLRGKRVDMLQSTSNALQVYRSAANTETPTDLAQQNQSLIDLGERFAVVKNSVHTSGSSRTETLHFDAKDGSMNPIVSGYAESPDVEDLGVEGDPATNREDLPYTNLFRYNVDFGSRAAQEGNGSLGYSEAEEFFLSQKYRIVFDEVPQNADSIGKYFPVVYGSVKRVPLLQVISHKVLKEDQATAGDDLYIYASHSCLSKHAVDFDIELGYSDNQGTDTEVVRIQGLPTAANRNKPESPFPKKVNNHAVQQGQSIVGGNILYSPYHKVEVKQANSGKTYYGIRLRGSEWNQEVGSMDKRYPIRHGVGTTKLLASFAGKVDSRGRFIQHPVDVIRDFVKTYGKYPYTENMFDEENLAFVKSLTAKLKVAVFLNEPLPISEFIDKVCRQTGLTWYPDGGQIRLAVLNLNDPALLQSSKPIAEHLNLIQAVSGKDGGKEVAYSRILYRYQKNFMTNAYDRVIDLNPRNNQYCAASAKALGSKKEFEIDADYVNDPGVAYFAAARHAAILARSRIEYNLEVVRNSDVFRPGDLVPVTYSPLGLRNVPMIIQSVQELEFTDKIVAVRFV